jgi:hypothetical protein
MKMKAAINNSISDTLKVIKYCDGGIKCPNHYHGIIDTTYIVSSNPIYTTKSYWKVFECENPKDKTCQDIYLDINGIYYTLDNNSETAPNIIFETKQFPKNSFDSIKPSTAIFPAAKPFVPQYFTHSQYIPNVPTKTQMIFDIASFNVIVWVTIGYIIRSYKSNSWYKLWNDIICA